MTEQPILTDSTLEAMLARRAGAGAPDGLAMSIATAVDTLPGTRRPWWSVLAPPEGLGPAFRTAWVVALIGLLLAASVSAVYVGRELLRRDSDLSVVPPGSLMLTLAHPGEVTAVAWSPDGTRLATGSTTTESDPAAEWTRDTARIWDATTGDEVLRMEQTDAQIDRIAYSPDGTRLVIGSFDPMIFDPVTGAALPGGFPEFLAFSPDGTRVATGGAWGWAGILDATTGEVQLELPFAPRWMSDATWSPDGTLLATVWGSSVKIWNASTGDEQLMFGPYFADEVEWSPDGSRIATAGDDASGPIIWDSATGDRLVTIVGHTFNGVTVSWSPDGTRIATGGRDGTARVWDATTGEELATFTGHTGPLTDVAWNPDGTRIATASEDGTAKIWRAPAAVEARPSETPAPSATLAPLVVQPLGAPAVVDTRLGTITWQSYQSAGLGNMIGTPYGPVALVGNDLRWLGRDGTWEGRALPWEASPLIWDGHALYTCGTGLPFRLLWDGSGWLLGDPLDVPRAVRPVEQIATGPRGTIVFGEVDFAIAVDGQHFVAATRPPALLDPVEPFVLATADGFVALVTTNQKRWDMGAFEPIPWFTADGVAWEQRSAASPFGEAAWVSWVASRAGRFVAVGHIGASQGSWAAWVSDDGITWERLTGFGDSGALIPSGGGSYPFVGVAAGDPGWVVYSKDGSAWASSDGRAWQPMGDWPGVRGMGWIPPELVVAGDMIVGMGRLADPRAGVIVGTID